MTHLAKNQTGSKHILGVVACDLVFPSSTLFDTAVRNRVVVGIAGDLGTRTEQNKLAERGFNDGVLG